MSNICDTQYKVRGSHKALSDLWNTLQMMGVNSKDVYLYKLAEHYALTVSIAVYQSVDISIGLSSRITRTEVCYHSIQKVHGLPVTCSLMN